MSTINCNHPTCNGITCRRPAKEKAPRKPIKKVGNKRKLQECEYRPLAKAFKEANPMCQVPNCSNPTSDIHHKKGRTGDLLTDVRYFMAVCRPCHTAIHDGGIKGLLLSKFKPEETA
jgi:hypothetical protein